MEYCQVEDCKYNNKGAEGHCQVHKEFKNCKLRLCVLIHEKDAVAESPAAMAGSAALAEAIKKKINRILLDAIGGHKKQYRTEDGFIKWGLVEKEMNQAIDSEVQ